ncbi:hypothetical protein B9G69_010195 [Bdellovibrio sp. SKB1291214]|uniref:hypothetical protein n=1 Tax=Bdellovibrio sp. SKB1291214 TaxID=1732569 RepID=UPI000B51AC3C|nr:hypothetical protein [Bdellovibrio sp. SKB1291214]UYL07415.1 hypothetical protein B9G69_010195 [Bdellovibrio sp. SKB1291214]
MKLNLLSAILVLGISSSALAKSGAEQFVSNYAKLPKSYDAVQFEGKALSGFQGRCVLAITAGYMNDGMKYLSLMNDVGETMFVSIDSKKAYPGNVIKISQRDEEVDEFNHHYPIVYSLKLEVDDGGKPLRAKGKIDRRFPYRDTNISCSFN